MVFRTGDWHHLTNVMSKMKVFFARKFEAAIDQSIINKLEEQIAHSPLDFQGWDSYWESAYHVADTTPPPNEALLAVAISLARHALSLLLQDRPENCPAFKPVSIISITSYFRMDRYIGDLIFFESDQKTKFELLAKPLNKATFMEGGSRLLTSIEVGSDYDPKEQVLRNRLGVLSPKSKPVVMYRWNDHANVTSEVVNFIWFDSSRALRAVQQGNVSETTKVTQINGLRCARIFTMNCDRSVTRCWSLKMHYLQESGQLWLYTIKKPLPESTSSWFQSVIYQRQIG